MARTKAELPPYRIHKGTGQGYVNLDGERVYLGKDSPATKKKYDRTVAEWLARGRRRAVAVSDLTVLELCTRFMRWAETYFRGPDGTLSSHFGNYKAAIKPLLALYETTPVKDFGPLGLKAVRQKYVDGKLSRCGVNAAVGRVRRIFKWGVSEGIVDVHVHGALLTVEGLRRGRCEAVDLPPVKPVPSEHVEAVKRHVSPQVAALIDLQLLTGARAGELVVLRPKDLDMTGRVWLYRPGRHKGEWRGLERVVYIGPQAQTIIREYLARPIDSFLFMPLEAERNRRAKCKTHRRPNQPVEAPKTGRTLSEHYTTAAYRRSIARACVLAKVPHWHPHQLRHSCGTALRKEFNLETARLILGHRSPAITSLYAELDQGKAIEVMEKVG